ncbi:MAG: electron transport complex subunit RsxE [Clostridia bacterium]|nr:electron transport complex subunit RsxE [Clostridia bacterium]
MAENGKMSILTKGIVKENPVLRLVLGTCPTLAVTTAAINGIGMGVAATLVLIGSNVAISLLRNIIPDKVRIPAYITIIAAFVTIIQMLVKAFLPSIDSALGIFLPLIVVNCIILARAEMFASKNAVLPSILDAVGMGIGFTAALTLMGMIRELFGAGTLFGMEVTQGAIAPMVVFILPPGGFFVFGVLVALSNKLAVRMGKKPAKNLGCGNCKACGGCEMAAIDEAAPADGGVVTNADVAEAAGESYAETEETTTVSGDGVTHVAVRTEAEEVQRADTTEAAPESTPDTDPLPADSDGTAPVEDVTLKDPEPEATTRTEADVPTDTADENKKTDGGEQ